MCGKIIENFVGIKFCSPLKVCGKLIVLDFENRITGLDWMRDIFTAKQFDIKL